MHNFWPMVQQRLLMSRTTATVTMSHLAAVYHPVNELEWHILLIFSALRMSYTCPSSPNQLRKTGVECQAVVLILLEYGVQHVMCSYAFKIKETVTAFTTICKTITLFVLTKRQKGCLTVFMNIFTNHTIRLNVLIAQFL